jgi:DNA-binding SARP family transcriptional activator
VSDPSTGPEAARPAVEVRLLNGFELLCGGQPLARPLSAQRLVAFLAFQERGLQRLYVAGKLWPESTEERALACLRSALWRANQATVPLIRAFDTRLALDPCVRIDIREASVQAQRLIDGTASKDLRFGDFLLTGELVPDWYDDWLVIERERLRQLRLHALEALSARLLARACYGEAAETALSAIAGEPLRESAHRALIRVHLAEDNPGEALRQYELFRDLLRTRLGLRPSPRIRELVGEVARGNGGVTGYRNTGVSV